MPKADVTIRFSASLPTFCYPAGAESLALPSGISAAEEPTSQEVNVPGAFIAGSYGVLFDEADVYVDGSVESSGNGSTWAQAFKTIAEGLSALQSGETMLIAAGTYVDDPIENPDSGFDDTNRTIVQANPGDEVVLYFSNFVAGDNGINISSGQYITVDGITVGRADGVRAVYEGCKLQGTAKHIRVQNCTFRYTDQQGILTGFGLSSDTNPDDAFYEFLNNYLFDCGNPAHGNQKHGIYLARSRKTKVWGNVVEQCYNYGIQVWTSSGDYHLTQGADVRYNYVYGNRGTLNRGGIIVRSDDAIVANNIVHTTANGTHGIRMANGANQLCYNNTVYNAAGAGVDNTSGAIVRNNISYNNASDYAGSTTAPNWAGNTQGSPLFISGSPTAAADFKLQTDSPCKDTGADLSPTITDDFDGVSRPQGLGWDMGAYERNVRAFVDAEGFGTETTHGRGGTVLKVDSLADDGSPGTLRWALTQTYPRIIVFDVCGTIGLTTRIALDGTHSNVYVAGHTAPGGGICLKQAASDKALMEFSRNTTNGFKNGVFKNIRFRHGQGGNSTNQTEGDAFVIKPGTSDLVFDRCAMTWHVDEAFSFYSSATILEEFSGWDQNNITFSRCIIGEGGNGTASGGAGHNYGPLISGGGSGRTLGVYNVTFHNNLIVHSDVRNVRMVIGSRAANRGIQYINNVHYNTFTRDYGIAQNQFSGGSAVWCDVIGDYIKEGPNTGAGHEFFLLTRDGDEWGSDPPGTYYPSQIYLSGSTWRDVNGNPTADNDEVDNFNMLRVRDGAQEATRGVHTWVQRSQPMTTQPINPVTEVSAADAYTAVVTNKKVGPLPHDTVDSRLINDAATGAAYNVANLPSTAISGGQADWPTLSTDGYYAGNPAWTTQDTSGNGLPDYYQNGVLGIDVNSAYNPADTYTVGNGYTDIENWMESIEQALEAAT